MNNADELFEQGKRLFSIGQYENSFRLFLEAAEQGHSEAQYYVGDMYYEGLGVSVDMGESFIWMKKAAENGNVLAMTNVGRCYQYGDGVAIDYEKALEWTMKAAENGDPMGLHNIATFYRDGSLLPKDEDKAIAYFKKAVDKGLGRAMNNLGVIYQDRGEYSEAYKLYSMAAERKEPLAFGNLAHMHYQGLGCEKDILKAIDFAVQETNPKESFVSWFLPYIGIRLVARAMTLMDDGLDAPNCIAYAHRCRIPSSWWLDAPYPVAFELEDRFEEARAIRQGNEYLVERKMQEAFRSFSYALYIAPNKETLSSLLAIDPDFLSEVDGIN